MVIRPAACASGTTSGASPARRRQWGRPPPTHTHRLPQVCHGFNNFGHWLLVTTRPAVIAPPADDFWGFAGKAPQRALAHSCLVVAIASPHRPARIEARAVLPAEHDMVKASRLCTCFCTPPTIPLTAVSHGVGCEVTRGDPGGGGGALFRRSIDGLPATRSYLRCIHAPSTTFPAAPAR